MFYTEHLLVSLKSTELRCFPGNAAFCLWSEEAIIHRGCWHPPTIVTLSAQEASFCCWLAGVGKSRDP